MEIPTPHRPLKSFREFLVHIVIVTIGILIALWFDGIREGFHERQLVQEARENFRLDIGQNQAHLKAEIQNLDVTLGQISKILKEDLSGGNNGTAGIAPSFYFFRNTSWDTALSTGALAHMKPAEVVRYAELHEAVSVYSELEHTSLGVYLEYSALEDSSDQSAETIRKKRDRLLLLQHYLTVLRQMADQFSATLEAAKKAE